MGAVEASVVTLGLRGVVRLWKTPEYRSVHRRYSGRMQELNRAYGGMASGSY